MSDRTPSQWQSGVDCAQLAVMLGGAIQLGFVESDGKRLVVRSDKAKALLRDGKKLGYVPRAVAVEIFIHRMAKGIK